MTALPTRRARKTPEDRPVLTIHGQLMRDLATRAMAAGGGGLTKVGVASVQHGEGATTIARSLAACLAETFGQRVVLIEANQRSPSLRVLCRVATFVEGVSDAGSTSILPAARDTRSVASSEAAPDNTSDSPAPGCNPHNQRSPSLRVLCGLQPGAGLSEVLSGAASLEATLRVSRAAGKMLVLPASDTPSTNVATLHGPSLRDLMAELFFYADALVFDLAPLLPYPDACVLGRALDGVAVVMQAGKSTRAECTQAVGGLQGAGVPVLGAVLNREKRFLPRFMGRRH